MGFDGNNFCALLVLICIWRRLWWRTLCLAWLMGLAGVVMCAVLVKMALKMPLKIRTEAVTSLARPDSPNQLRLALAFLWEYPRPGHTCIIILCSICQLRTAKAGWWGNMAIISMFLAMLTSAQFLLRRVRRSHAPGSAQRCAEFSASACEGVRRSGWKFSILALWWPLFTAGYVGCWNWNSATYSGLFQNRGEATQTSNQTIVEKYDGKKHLFMIPYQGEKRR